MKFTQKERQVIEKLLEEGREMQKNNGNETCTHEEIFKILEVTPEEIKEAQRLKQEEKNNRKTYSEKELYDIFGPEELMITSLQ